jgi:hypothetical protein
MIRLRELTNSLNLPYLGAGVVGSKTGNGIALSIVTDKDLNVPRLGDNIAWLGLINRDRLPVFRLRHLPVRLVDGPHKVLTKRIIDSQAH